MLKGNDVKVLKDRGENEIDVSFTHASFSGARAFTVYELNTKVGLKRRSYGEEKHFQIFFFPVLLAFFGKRLYRETASVGEKQGG